VKRNRVFTLDDSQIRKLLLAVSVSLGVTSIYLLWLIGPLISSTHDAVYHWSESPFELFVPADPGLLRFLAAGDDGAAACTGTAAGRDMVWADWLFALDGT